MNEQDERLRIATEVLQERGLPKGEVRRLLEENGVNEAVIDQVATRLVPYGYS